MTDLPIDKEEPSRTPLPGQCLFFLKPDSSSPWPFNASDNFVKDRPSEFQRAVNSPSHCHSSCCGVCSLFSLAQVIGEHLSLVGEVNLAREISVHLGN